MTRKTSPLAFGVVAVAIVSGAANAEVVIGDLTRIVGEVHFSGLPVDVVYSGFTHDGVQYSEFLFHHDPAISEMWFAESDMGDARHFEVGEFVSSADWGLLQYGSRSDYKGEYHYNYMGEVGEPLFIGLAFEIDSVLRYGFMQLMKTSESQYDWIGYAYESEGGTPIEVFDTTVPAPSSLALLGLGGLGVARRRR